MREISIAKKLSRNRPQWAVEHRAIAYAVIARVTIWFSNIIEDLVIELPNTQTAKVAYTFYEKLFVLEKVSKSKDLYLFIFILKV